MGQYDEELSRKDKPWSFDSSEVEHIPPIMKHLTHQDQYFEQDSGITTIQLVLDGLLEQLPEEMEEAIRLVHLSGLSYRSVARSLGIDHKTVKNRAEKGLEILREKLTNTVWLSTLISDSIPAGVLSEDKIKPVISVASILSNLLPIKSGNEAE